LSTNILSGRLEKLEEIDCQGGVHVEVAISVSTPERQFGQTLFSEADNLGQRNVPAVAAEMNHTMHRAIEKLLSTLPTSTTNVSQGNKECKK
jgi:hypothetical protein